MGCKLLSTDHRGGAVTGWGWGAVTGEGACVEAKKGHSLRTAGLQISWRLSQRLVLLASCSKLDLQWLV